VLAIIPLVAEVTLEALDVLLLALALALALALVTESMLAMLRLLRP
jgi:hypothetical protein